MDEIFDESMTCAEDDAAMAVKARKALADNGILAFNLRTKDPHALSLAQLAKALRAIDGLLKTVGKQVEKIGPNERLMPVIHTMASIDCDYQLQIRILTAPKIRRNRKPKLKGRAHFAGDHLDGVK